MEHLISVQAVLLKIDKWCLHKKWKFTKLYRVIYPNKFRLQRFLYHWVTSQPPHAHEELDAIKSVLQRRKNSEVCSKIIITKIQYNYDIVTKN